MAQSFEMFLRTIRTSSEREQAELWKVFLQRAYSHERVNMLRQVLAFMDREDPQGLREAVRAFKEQRANRDQVISSNSDAPQQEPYATPRRDTR